MSNAITLSNQISIGLMLEIAQCLEYRKDRDIAEFKVVREYDEIHLCACYHGNGLFVPVQTTIFRYREEHVSHANAFAKDLNTLFGLK